MQNASVLVVAGYSCNSKHIPPELFERWWEDQSQHGERLNHRINTLYASFRSKPRGLKDHKLYRSQAHRQRLKDEIKRNNLLSLGMECLPDAYELASFDGSISSYYCEDEEAGISMVNAFRTEVFQNESVSAADSACSILERYNTYHPVEYGFATIMPANYMPAGFAIGLSTTTADRLVRRDATTWRRFASSQCDIRIRNVFAINYLSETHLAIPVGSVALGDWIRQTAQRGRLVFLGSRQYCWTIGEDDGTEDWLRWNSLAIQEVRSQLAEWSIFPWQELQP